MQSAIGIVLLYYRVVLLCSCFDLLSIDVAGSGYYSEYKVLRQNYSWAPRPTQIGLKYIMILISVINFTKIACVELS